MESVLLWGADIGRNAVRSQYQTGQCQVARRKPVCLLWNSNHRVVSGVILPGIWGQEATQTEIGHRPVLFSFRKKLEQICNFYSEVYHRVDLAGSECQKILVSTDEIKQLFYCLSLFKRHNASDHTF